MKPQSSKPGCLGGLIRIIFILVLGVILVVLTTAVFAPWGFFMGGSFHPLAEWHGWGVMHSSASGGDYVLYVRMYPRPAGRGSRGAPHVRGTALLCTPRGERFTLTLGGDFDRSMYLSSDGKRAELYMYNRSGLARQYGLNTDTRPGLNLHGAWHNPDLVLDDHGSLGYNFQPDGTVYTGHAVNRPWGKPVQITLHEGSESEFDAACAKK